MLNNFFMVAKDKPHSFKTTTVRTLISNRLDLDFGDELEDHTILSHEIHSK